MINKPGVQCVPERSVGKDIRKVWGAINRWAGVDQDPGCKLGASKSLMSQLKQAGLSGQRKQNLLVSG